MFLSPTLRRIGIGCIVLALLAGMVLLVQWLGRGSKTIHSIGKTQAAERLEAASGYAALWLAKGIGPKYAAAGSKRDRVIADMVRHSSTLREVARMQVRARDDLTPEQQEELLAAIESFEREANRPGGLPQ